MAEGAPTKIQSKSCLFFQAEDGIRDLTVTGVQTCALPILILADEPTGNLHSAQGDEIMQLFKRLNDAGTTIIQVTHSERNASYGHRIIQLKDGWVVGETATADASASAAQSG